MHSWPPVARPIVPIFAIGFCIAFVGQLSRSMYLDANGIIGRGHIDLLGFVAMAGVMAIRFLNQETWSRINVAGAATISVFLLYMAVCVASVEKELLNVFLSRHGIVCWLVVGVLASVALFDLRQYVAMTYSPRLVSVAMVLLASLPILPALFLRGIADNSTETESYQAVAAGATILIVFTLIALDKFRIESQRFYSHWSGLFAYTIFCLSSLILTYLIAKIQSTGIVLVWLCSISLVFFHLGRVLPTLYKGIALVSLVTIALLVVPYFWTDLQETTRFQRLADGDWMISSLEARLAILPVFWDQWLASPLTGNYRIEETFGEKGTYVHSLPLSLLTHTGAIGFLIYMIAIRFLFGSTSKWIDFEILVFLMLFAVAAISTFFTWIPIWFATGFLIVRQEQTPTLTPSSHFH